MIYKEVLPIIPGRCLKERLRSLVGFFVVLPFSLAYLPPSKTAQFCRKVYSHECVVKHCLRSSFVVLRTVGSVTVLAYMNCPVTILLAAPLLHIQTSKSMIPFK